MLYFQVRQELAQEYEHVKDINLTLNSFKQPTSSPRGSSGDNYQSPSYDDPRDKDVWPPPTPLEHNRLNFVIICILFYIRFFI